MKAPKRNFKESIRHLFLMYTLVPIAILFLLFLLFTVINSKIILSNKTNDANRTINHALFEVYNNYSQELNRMASSTQVIDFIRTRLEGQYVYEEFYDFNNGQKVKSVFHIIDTSGVFIASSAASDYDIEKMVYKDIVPRIARNPYQPLIERNYIRYPYDRYTVYTFGKAIINDNKVAGYLIYQLYEEDMQKLIFVQNNEIAVITDKHNTIISTNNNITKGLMNKFNPTIASNGYITLNNGNYYLSKSVIPFANLNVYTLNSNPRNGYIYISFTLFIVATGVLLWFLIHFLANKMSSRHTRSIDKLLFAVNQLQQGKMLSYVEIHTGDEFETLANQYNIMLNRLNELMNKNEELSDIRRVIEVKQLQSQFHPHFIFNVLETLRYAIVVDSQKAQMIVLILSRLLRYSISNDGGTVPLKDDLNHVNDYLKLQQIRFNDRLSYSFELDQEADQALVPKLLLQAIIENAIKYGYMHQENLFISIRGRVHNQDLVFEITDDGYGMNPERLSQIREILQDTNNHTPHIGLYNIHRRLMLLYGEGYGVQVDSELGVGTCVTLTIPYNKEDSHV
ncbi:MAG: sensor histidine kinase [Candidatus Cohnella colombiensis]|uniref:Sensor histidine kinase n=1 Tax=Candidatus Cohnella colombiensis TaxID=3121368 RepID=A0AA95EXS8_9BACL|nr:MAG: sensor histidine kinase [Cohnella sp.]